MKLKKPSKPHKQDKKSQEDIENRVKTEKVELGHPDGKRRFERTLERALKKKSR